MNDSCPQCLARDVAPHTAQPVGESIAAGYVCPACRHSWSCSWHTASLTPSDLRAAARTHRTTPTATTT